MASLCRGRTAAAQCGLFTYKSVPVIFEPSCTLWLVVCGMSRIQLPKGNSLLWCLTLVSLWNLTDYRIITQYLASQKHICDNHFSVFCNLNWMGLNRQVKQYACFTGHTTSWNPLYLHCFVVASSCIQCTVIIRLLTRDFLLQSGRHESLHTDHWRCPLRSTRFRVKRNVYNMAYFYFTWVTNEMQF